MPEDLKQEHSVIHTAPTGLVRVESSIAIINKILFGSISDLFNKAFCKMNSRDIKVVDKDYLFLFETDPFHRKNIPYSYKANDKDDYKEALDMFSTILDIKAKHIISLEMSAICKHLLGDYTGAIEDYSKAIEIDPKDAIAYIGRAFSKERLGDIDGAVKDRSIYEKMVV